MSFPRTIKIALPSDGTAATQLAGLELHLKIIELVLEQKNPRSNSFFEKTIQPF